MSEMKIENHFAQGAIVNNGQMNVGGGTIHVHVQGKQQVVEEQAENATCNPQLCNFRNFCFWGDAIISRCRKCR